MTHKLLRILLTWLALSVILYVLFALGAWELNPGKWNDLVRITYAVLLGIALFGATIGLTDPENLEQL